MKPELRVKFLQHLNKRKREEGFTLIELLVVVIIIGILAAVALPSLLSQANKAKQVEARNNTGALNRAQQAYHLENSSAFTSIISVLGVGIPTQTVNYQYSIVTGIVAGESVAVHAACAIKRKLKAYQGQVYTTDVTSGGVTEAVTPANIFESIVPAPDYADQRPYCGGADKFPATPGSPPDPVVPNTGWKGFGPQCYFDGITTICK